MTKDSQLELTILMPCLNEAETLATCIDKAQGFLRRHAIAGEVLIADNGSTDGSPEIARRHGARVVAVPEKGYGAALSGGIAAARGKFVIMGDADDSYDFSALDPFVEKLREGYELVMGNRFRGGIRPGAMPPLHRYLGNPVLTGIGRLLFKSPVADFHCGLRGFDRQSILALDLHTQGMEFASEMVVKATLHRLRIAEVPTTLSPDGRSRPPHLRSWRDGWRHLRFLLIFSPRWLFFYPGLALLFLGLLGMLWLLPGARTVWGISFDINTLLYAMVFALVGLQVIGFALFSKVFAISAGLLPPDDRFTQVLGKLTLERGLAAGALMAALGTAGSVYSVGLWGMQSFGPTIPGAMMRVTIPSVALLAMGVQIMFSHFFLGLLRIKYK